MENEINLSQSLCITWQLCAAAYWRDQRILLQRQQKGLEGGKEEESEWIKLISLRNPTSSQKKGKSERTSEEVFWRRGVIWRPKIMLFFHLPMSFTKFVSPWWFFFLGPFSPTQCGRPITHSLSSSFPDRVESHAYLPCIHANAGSAEYSGDVSVNFELGGDTNSGRPPLPKYWRFVATNTRYSDISLPETACDQNQPNT